MVLQLPSPLNIRLFYDTGGDKHFSLSLLGVIHKKFYRICPWNVTDNFIFVFFQKLLQNVESTLAIWSDNLGPIFNSKLDSFAKKE